MKTILNILLSGIAVYITSNILPGVSVENFTSALIAAIILGIVNGVIKPFLLILTLPITILTLGLFTFIINAFMVLIVDAIVPGFEVSSFFLALVFSLVLSLINSFLHSLGK